MGLSALQIGEVAIRAGVSIDTVRYYERRKLIKRASRSNGGFRLFAPEIVERIRFIKQAQEFGFSLDEIRAFLTDGDGIDGCRRVRDLLRVKLDEIDERMKKMRDFRKALQQNLAACEREISEHGKEAHCPVVVNIERGTKKAVHKKSYEKT
jgi:DNA-binding transcriptional MerR regulator